MSFSLLFGLGGVLGHVYLYRRLVRPLFPTSRARRAALVALGLLSLLLLTRRALQTALPVEMASLVTRFAHGWIGLVLMLVLACLAVDATRLLTRLRPRRRPASVEEAPPIDLKDADRRRFLARVTAGGAALAGASTAGYGTWRAFTPPDVTELPLKLEKLPPALDGLTIVQLTDLHVGHFIGRDFVAELVDRANALKPDLVAITGDLVDGQVDHLGPAVAALSGLRSRYGTFFVNGNHEYYSGEVAWNAFLESQGITVLRNRHVRIGDAGASLDLIGVDDWSGGRQRGRPGYDLAQAVAGRDPARASVLLAHQPANFEEVARQGLDVQLSGHTHGGQLFPATMLIGLRWPYTRGLYTAGASRLYVSRGCGFWGPPMRVGSEPELVRVVLTT